MADKEYLMESKDEAVRLDLKTDPKKVKKQGCWAGIKPGMRLGDFGCGAGITSYNLNQLVQPGGSTIGVDISPQRIDYAESHYQAQGLSFTMGDIRKPLDALGQFDFIWVRFVLEYYLDSSFNIVRNIVSALKPGGILFLADLDYNCLTHFEISERLSETMNSLINNQHKIYNFDPYVGRKLYSYLYDLGFSDIDVDLTAHHLFFGEISPEDIFNWNKKLEIISKIADFSFNEFYPDGFSDFQAEFQKFFHDPRRFTYTPLICVRGIKP